VSEGAPFTGTGAFQDLSGGDDRATVSIRFDGGSSLEPAANSSGEFSFAHVFAHSSPHTATITVTDRFGGTFTETLNITVDNVAPVVDAGEDAVALLGETFRRTATFIDPGQDAWTVTVDFGDGSAPQEFSGEELSDHKIEFSHVYDTVGAKTVTVTVNDGEASGIESFEVVIGQNHPPAIDPPPVKTAIEDQRILFQISGNDPEGALLVYSLGSGAPPGARISASGIFSWIPSDAQGPQSHLVSITATDVDGLQSTTTAEIIVVEPALIVLQGPEQTFLTPTGAVIQFNRAFDPAVLNVYHTRSGEEGAADIELLDSSGVSVQGSLIVTGSREITFVKTSGVLSPGAYTLAVRSETAALRRMDGSVLDGDNDGVPGGDFVHSLGSFAPEAVIIDIPNFARGAGQPVNLGGIGIPVRINSAAGVTAVSLTLKYDPILLAITSVAAGAALPSDALIEANPSGTPGEISIAFASTGPLGAGPAELFRLLAEVPATAFYRDSEVLRLTRISVNEGAVPVSGDDAVHVAAYIGDATGSGTYSSLDAQRVLSVAVGLDTGFAAFLKLDPLIVGDVSGNGAITAQDGSIILQEVVGIDRPEIPPIPDIVRPPIVADPLVRLATGHGLPGEVVPVGVLIDDASHLQTVDLEIRYDSSMLDVSRTAVRPGALAPGATLLANVDDANGRIRVSLLLKQPLSHGSGSLVDIDFQIRANAHQGSTSLDLVSVMLNEGSLILTVEPVHGADSTDGLIVIDGVVIAAATASTARPQPVTLAASFTQPEIRTETTPETGAPVQALFAAKEDGPAAFERFNILPIQALQMLRSTTDRFVRGLGRHLDRIDDMDRSESGESLRRWPFPALIEARDKRATVQVKRLRIHAR
jgi:PKD repeat protein